MKVYSDRDYHGIILASVTLIIVITIMMWFEYHDIVGCLIFLAFIPLIVLSWVALGRTIYFDSKGITVQFLCWKHSYIWCRLYNDV